DLDTLYSFESAAATLALSLSGGVTLTDALLTSATVTTPDIEASNGVIHVINKVLVPPGVLNVVQMAQLNPAFSTLVTAVTATSDLAGVLSGTGPFTVFAPTDTAFGALPAGTVTGLLADPDNDLRDILLFHVVAGDVRAADVVALSKPASVATALTGSSFTVTDTLQITETFISPASLVATDVVASNGVIHVIDQVLNPSFAV
ncbi:MAG: fasciclin domain-containing protein, partial [Burkholderiales bacterium]